MQDLCVIHAKELGFYSQGIRSIWNWVVTGFFFFLFQGSSILIGELLL